MKGVSGATIIETRKIGGIGTGRLQTRPTARVNQAHSGWPCAGSRPWLVPGDCHWLVLTACGQHDSARGRRACVGSAVSGGGSPGCHLVDWMSPGDPVQGVRVAVDGRARRFPLVTEESWSGWNVAKFMW